MLTSIKGDILKFVDFVGRIIITSSFYPICIINGTKVVYEWIYCHRIYRTNTRSITLWYNILPTMVKLYSFLNFMFYLITRIIHQKYAVTFISLSLQNYFLYIYYWSIYTLDTTFCYYISYITPCQRKHPYSFRSLTSINDLFLAYSFISNLFLEIITHQ